MRRLILGLAVGASVLLHAGVASAHEEITPSTVPTGKPVFFSLSAANESTADLVKVTLAAPAGVDFGATTREPAGWTVNRTDQAITWTGGAIKPGHFEEWGFEIESADQPGTLAYMATLAYSDGKTDPVTIDVTAETATASQAATKSGGSSSRADTALVFAIAALALAVVGLVRGMRRGAPAAPAAAGGGQEADQDW